MAEDMGYGAQVRQARGEMRLTQKQLAARLGIRNGHLSEIERGTRTPGHDLADRIEYETGVRRETPRERRLREERDALAAHVAALTADRDGLLADLIHFAQVQHEHAHPQHSGTWLSCDRGSCPGLRRAVSRARGATTPPSGAREGNDADR